MKVDAFAGLSIEAVSDAAGHQSGIHNAGTSKAAAQRRRRWRTRRESSRLELACAYV